MPLFPRRSPSAEDPAAGVEAFWRWWVAEGAAACAAAIGEQTPDAVVELLTERVGSVAEGLAWELAPGAEAPYLLVVTAEGNPDLRAAARRWLLAGRDVRVTDGAGGLLWEYADTRRPGDLDGVLRLGTASDDLEIHLEEVWVLVHLRAHSLDVVVQHPLLGMLAEREARQVAFLALDEAVGEEAVETWLGAVEISATRDPAAIPLGQLRRRVAELAAANVDADGNPTWALLRGEGPHGPVVVATVVPLRVTLAPHLDHHLAVTAPFADQTAEGMPGESSLLALRELEGHVTDRIGGSGRLVAHETSAGRRTLHYYVSATSPVGAVVEAAVRGWPDGRVAVEVQPDPGWEAVAAFRT
ncbi:DUF695 domain-containing protein [Nocardioides sp.]|uniref:DUF695 domain-containing protein n=1 Tax=Nocardioides sp. TaxID=35761 RepID=UPI00321B9128